MSKILLKAITPEGVEFNEFVESFHIKTIDGEVTILPHHFPLLTSVQTCVCHFTKNDEIIRAFVDEGILHVSANKIELLVASFDLKEEINLERAKRAKQRAEQRLMMSDKEIDKIRAQKALIRAEARISLWEE